MLGATRKRAERRGEGCWRHASVVGERACERCGVACCSDCWLETPRASLCIECALEFAGVRAPRRRRVVERSVEPSPLAQLSWERSAGLIDLAPAHRRRRPEPVRRQLFIRAA